MGFLMYINRSVEQAIAQHFRDKSREGALVPGIVGCGKTTMITHLLSQLAGEFECFSFTGDEIARSYFAYAYNDNNPDSPNSRQQAIPHLEAVFGITI